MVPIAACACFSSAIPGPPGPTGATGPQGVQGPPGTPTVAALDTPCIDMTVTGAPNYVVSAVPILAQECNGLECSVDGLLVRPSADTGNALICGSDGRLFTPTFVATDVAITGINTNCATTTVVESPANTFTIQVDPVISPAVGNSLSCTPAGLFVSSGQTTIVAASDTPCMDVSVVEAPVGTFTVSAIPIIDPVAGNQLTCGAAGLLVPAAAVTSTVVLGGDTNCLDVTVVEAPVGTFTVSVDPILAPFNNLISCGGSGLVGSVSTLGNTGCIEIFGNGTPDNPLDIELNVNPLSPIPITCDNNGLSVGPAPATDVTINPVDTTCINMTVVEAPANTFTISADPIISPDACNGLVCQANGLFVSQTKVIGSVQTNGPCLSVPGAGTCADPFNVILCLSPDPCNTLECRANGLYSHQTLSTQRIVKVGFQTIPSGTCQFIGAANITTTCDNTAFVVSGATDMIAYGNQDVAVSQLHLFVDGVDIYTNGETFRNSPVANGSGFGEDNLAFTMGATIATAGVHLIQIQMCNVNTPSFDTAELDGQIWWI